VLDDLDLRILQELQRDGRASHRSLAALLGTTTPTIGARIQRLEETGVLRGVSADLSPQAVSGTLWTLLLHAPATAHKALVADLEADAGVERVLALSGGRILVLVRPASPAGIGQLEARLAAHGVTSHDSWAVTDVHVDRKPDLLRHGAVAVCAQCRGPIHGDGDSARVDGRRVWFCCAQCKRTFLDKHASLQRKAKDVPSAGKPRV
jgi:DNA-binding Lrp family transcriptional regulator